MTPTNEGIILSCVGGRYTVLCDGRRHSCYAKGSLRHAGIKPVCGDRVLFVEGVSFPDDGTPLPPSTDNDGYLCEVLPRKSLLRRPPIANIDTLLIFTAAANPAPDTTYIDRLSVCAILSGIQPILVCNKSDLAPTIAQNLIETYQNAGIPAFAISAGKEQDLDIRQLKERLEGKITAMAGFSGVGKTTFFNLLFPEEKGIVGELSQKLARGKNTTRTTQLYSLSRSVLQVNGLFADTAGFSRLELSRLDEIKAEDLPFYFPEFEPYLTKCRFTKCTHKTELGCAIRQAVEENAIPTSRYESFLTFLQELNKK